MEEQLNELEALQAIYCEEINVISQTAPIQYSITVSSDSNAEEKDELSLMFTYTPNYPDEAPSIEVTLSCDYCDESDEQELTRLLKNEANNNLGAVMVFTLVSFASEWLNAKKDEQRHRAKLENEVKKRLAEEAEMKKFEGTRVTVETFLAWKKHFDAELCQTNAKQLITDLSSRKLTGKELFEKDQTLNESDLSFLDEEGDNDTEVVAVDESLFQDLDDLDINELNEC